MSLQRIIRNNILSFVVIFVLPFLSSAEVCKIFYNGAPQNLKDSIVPIPSKAVALSEYVHVSKPSDLVKNIVDTTATPAIFFIIDHSGSMYLENWQMDRWGARFNVTRDLLDTLVALNPKIEVGIAVFRQYLYYYLPDDSTLFKNLSTDTGSYIPLLRLDSTYHSAVLGDATGYEILKYYLQTDTVKQGNYSYVDLKYKPTLNMQTSTNITTGFRAAKDAMKNTQISKEEQYIIFFSDGDANYPEDSTNMLEFIDGKDVPTTFTIFFSKDSTAPQNLVDMTNNIKNNGYSSSNQYSDLWTIDVSYDTLMAFILENLFSLIVQKTVSEPKQITINGKKPISSFDGNGYKFGDLFPFTGEYNDFNYKITYNLVIDSITDNGDTITISKDTTLDIKFTLALVDSVALPDSFDMLCWDRKIEFYYNNNKINAISESMKNVEVRFTSIKLDTLYDYKDVTLEFTASNSSDKENFKLSDNGNGYLSYTFEQAVGSVNGGNGIVEHEMIDTLIATFRNPALPLDTLQVKIPFVLSGTITPVSGYYFDNNADGHIDSVFIEMEGKDLSENSDDAEEIKSAIKLPDFRKFEIKDISVESDGVGLTVEEGMSDINTSVTNKDSIEISQKILSSGGWLTSSKIGVVDKAAPVIVSAILRDILSDTASDTLIVNFSESVNPVTYAEPFELFNVENNVIYSAVLTSVKHDNDVVRFVVENLKGATYIVNGDSIRINWKLNTVGDVAPDINYQRNEKNIRREITVKIVKNPIGIIPIVTTPVDFTLTNNGTFIPDDIVNILDDDTKKGLKIVNGKHVGMILIVKPDNLKKIDPNFTMEGTFSIFDPVGNAVVKDVKMVFSEKYKALVYGWNGKNSVGRPVGSGTYLAVFDSYILEGPNHTEKTHKVSKIYIQVRQ